MSVLDARQRPAIEPDFIRHDADDDVEGLVALVRDSQGVLLQVYDFVGAVIRDHRLRAA